MSHPDANGSATGGPDCGPPPGLEIPVNAATPPDEGLTAQDKDCVDSICQDMIQRTDDLLQEKVDKLLNSAAGQLQTLLNQQQEKVHTSLEQELQCCRDKVKSLEADKEQMHKSVMMLQDQLATLTAQFYNSSYSGWQNQGQMPMGGHLVNAGMTGPFMTLPSGFPLVPPFAATSEPAGSELGEVSQPSTTAPTSPHLTPYPSAPPTPARAPVGSPPTPTPPPGLPELPGAPPSAAPLPVPWIPPPPGLTDLPLDSLVKPSASISLSDAIDEENAKPVLGEKARLTPEQLHSEALQRMMEDGPDGPGGAVGSRLQSPCPTSPGPRLGTPSRNLTSPKYSFLSPKRTPRSRLHSHGGMKSPAINASPFVICESGGSVFGFTIRKADDCSLGLDVTHTDGGNYLNVNGIKPGGAIQAWNKQCVGGPAAGKAVMPGDRIVKVNNSTTPAEMLQECRDQKLLKFTVQRGEVDEDVLDLEPVRERRATQ